MPCFPARHRIKAPVSFPEGNAFKKQDPSGLLRAPRFLYGYEINVFSMEMCPLQIIE